MCAYRRGRFSSLCLMKSVLTVVFFSTICVMMMSYLSHVIYQQYDSISCLFSYVIRRLTVLLFCTIR